MTAPTPLEAALSRILLAAGFHDGATLESALDAAAGVATPAEIDELFLMAHLYTGVPRAVQAFTLWRARHPAAEAPSQTPTDVRAAGRAAFAAVYGPRVDRVHEALARLHPDFARTVLEHAYGQILSRSGLSLRVREMVALPMLAASRAPRQLASHVLGARRAGASDAAVLAAIELASGTVDATVIAAALQLARETLARG